MKMLCCQLKFPAAWRNTDCYRIPEKHPDSLHILKVAKFPRRGEVPLPSDRGRGRIPRGFSPPGPTALQEKTRTDQLCLRSQRTRDDGELTPRPYALPYTRGDPSNRSTNLAKRNSPQAAEGARRLPHRARRPDRLKSPRGAGAPPDAGTGGVGVLVAAGAGPRADMAAGQGARSPRRTEAGVSGGGGGNPLPENAPRTPRTPSPGGECLRRGAGTSPRPRSLGSRRGAQDTAGAAPGPAAARSPTAAALRCPALPAAPLPAAGRADSERLCPPAPGLARPPPGARPSPASRRPRLSSRLPAEGASAPLGAASEGRGAEAAAGGERRALTGLRRRPAAPTAAAIGRRGRRSDGCATAGRAGGRGLRPAPAERRGLGLRGEGLRRAGPGPAVRLRAERAGITARVRKQPLPGTRFTLDASVGVSPEVQGRRRPPLSRPVAVTTGGGVVAAL